MYKQKPGDPLKKLDTPTTFREDSPMMKMAKDGSNPMFKMDSGLYKGHPEDSAMMKMDSAMMKMDSGLYKHKAGHKGNDDKIKTEKLDEVIIYAPYVNRKKPREVGGIDAQVSGGRKFKVTKGKPVI